MKIDHLNNLFSMIKTIDTSKVSLRNQDKKIKIAEFFGGRHCWHSSANYLLTQRERKSKIPEFVRRVFSSCLPIGWLFAELFNCLLLEIFLCLLLSKKSSRVTRSAISGQRWNLQISVLKHKGSGKSWVSGYARKNSQVTFISANHALCWCTISRTTPFCIVSF